eukprot:6498325-Pyramimonas_sp.AAC.1
MGNVRAVRRTTARTSLDMRGHLANSSLPKPWKLPDIRGQAPPAPAEPAAPPPEARAAPPIVRLRAPRPGSRAGPTAGASSHDIT